MFINLYVDVLTHLPTILTNSVFEYQFGISNRFMILFNENNEIADLAIFPDGTTGDFLIYIKDIY